ncbi:MAG: formate dehydrogenase subunit gamma [Burkholderiaceae bacterium]|nr:formate dehydrogenase subunit gamma [Burkholderiaceae bacterium]
MTVAGSAAPAEFIEEAVHRALQAHAGQPGALLPVLHAVQDALGYVPPQAIEPIARALNLSRAEVYGVLTFYHHFRREPPGRHVLQLCQAEACQSMGARALAAQAQSLLGSAFHQTSADGAVTLEPVYCLGLCALAPAALLDGQPHARLTPEALADLLAQARAGAACPERS